MSFQLKLEGLNNFNKSNLLQMFNTEIYKQ